MERSLFAALIIIALIAIAAGLATTGAPARQPELSGTLNLLCTPHILWCEGMKTEFQRIYPKVTVEFVRLSSGEALTRLRNERANPQFDIWWGGPIDSFIAARAGRSARSLRLAQYGQSYRSQADEGSGQLLGRHLRRLPRLCQ